MSDSASEASNSKTSRLLELLTRWLTEGPLQRWPWLLPVISFAVGWIGFVLVQRTESMARGVAIVVLLGWPWLLAENTLGKLLVRLSKGRLSPRLLGLVTQNLQQEILFFTLPFLIGATQRDVGQMAFTGVIALGALLSSIDPVYQKYITDRPGGNMAFHAFCTFVGGLVILPMALQMPLERALPIALLLSGFWLLMSLPRMLAGSGTTAQRLLGVAAIVIALFALWQFRGHVPPAGLSLKGSRMTQTLNDLEPGVAIKQIGVDALKSEGLTAFVAIRAPGGLSQTVIFEWWHRGERLDQVPTQIQGGNESGWRTFSRKQNFPADPIGDWHVDVRTPQGQLICRLGFEVLAQTPPQKKRFAPFAIFAPEPPKQEEPVTESEEAPIKTDDNAPAAEPAEPESRPEPESKPEPASAPEPAAEPAPVQPPEPASQPQSEPEKLP